VTRLPDGQQRSDFWNEFAAPPAALVDDALRRWLTDSGAAAAVLAPGTRARAELAIEPVLTELYADASGSTPVARLALSALFLGLDREPPRILLQRSYAHGAPLAGTAPSAIAAGLNQALSVVLTQLEGDLRRL
jgi:ABC-type uncharacterized transport system auxiliary subunit